MAIYDFDRYQISFYIGQDYQSSGGLVLALNSTMIRKRGWVYATRMEVRGAGNDAFHKVVPVLYKNDTLIATGNTHTIDSESPRLVGVDAVFRLDTNDRVRWGFHRQSVASKDADLTRFDAGTYDDSYFNALIFGRDKVGFNPPRTLPSSATSVEEGYHMQGAIYYVENEAPSTPALTSPSSGSSVTPGSVALKGTLPHNNGDGTHDYSTLVRYQVFRDGGATPVIDDEFSVGSSADSFTANASLTFPGSDYSWRAMHRDSWGVWSGWSSQRSFKLSNAAPLKGSFTSPADGSTTSSTSVTLSGTLPHSGDGGHDYSERVQLQVFESGAAIAFLDETFATTQQQQNADSFSRTVSNLLSGATYYARYRHQDRAGSWSPYSDNRFFTVARVPDAPEPLTPLVKLDAVTAYSYRMTHQHPEGRPAKAVNVQLLNSAGSSVVWDSGTVTLSSQVSAGSVVTMSPNFASGATNRHPSLSWATGYTWRARVMDSLDVWSPFSAAPEGAFSTNSTPTVPTGLVPLNNARTGAREFSCAVSDPDGDTITAAQFELVRVSTGAIVTGYPKTTSIVDGRATITVPESDLTPGFQYRFRFRATDGLQPGYGPWSAYNLISYAIAPVVTLLSPAPRTNLIAEPSAEYTSRTGDFAEGEEDIAIWWNVVNQNREAGNYIYREETNDANTGGHRWVGVKTNEDEPAAYLESPDIPVNQLERYLVQLHTKKLPLDPASPDTDESQPDFLMQVMFYDAGSLGTPGAEIGGVTPNSIALTSAPALDYWTRSGGAIWPSDETSSPHFTSGTSSVRIRIFPVYDLSGRVAVDDVMFELMPDATTGTYAGQQYADSSFFGYTDPDSDGYGGSSGTYTGDAGSSPSVVIPVLTDPTQNHVMYSYTHASNVAMNATRVIVQRYDRGRRAWRPHHDSGYLAPAATPTVALPNYLFRNESRYRVRVVCRDTGAIDGESGWTEFVARYPGPPELAIYSYDSDPERATITIEFESAGIPESEFEGIEVARSAADEEMKVVDIVRNPGASSYTYHYPVSGKNYRLYVRQVQNVGPERIEGRWSYLEANVDYSGRSFLKDAYDPTLFVVFGHENGAGPNQPREAASEGYAPWGSLTPVHLFSETRYRADTTVIPMFDEPSTENIVSYSDKLAVLKRWERDRPPLCLMVHQPEPEKVFIALSGPVRLHQKRSVRYAEIEWQETSFAEPTPYEIEGLMDSLALSDLRTGA